MTQRKVTYIIPSLDERGKPFDARVEVLAPLHASIAQLDIWVAEYLRQNPAASLGSKSWSSPE